MMEGSGSGPGIGRPKNLRIRLLIRNTGKHNMLLALSVVQTQRYTEITHVPLLFSVAHRIF
jgi:hypothetical protein